MTKKARYILAKNILQQALDMNTYCTRHLNDKLRDAMFIAVEALDERIEDETQQCQYE